MDTRLPLFGCEEEGGLMDSLVPNSGYILTKGAVLEVKVNLPQMSFFNGGVCC
jgi:hypothetical protein